MPAWVHWLAERRVEGEPGVGHTVERLLGTSGKAFRIFWRATFESTIGLGCGCDGRHDRWSARYPYELSRLAGAASARR